ncbi:MAG TPA: NADH-quinone oxidoreductase subunit C [Terriglobales bacterium]|nr:NADH-quinone oxidoreductase subunit C [Terriglobales bacterium]
MNPVVQLVRDGARLVSVFGSRGPDRAVRLHYLLDNRQPDYLSFEFPVVGPVPALTPILPAAAWHERELHETYGVPLLGHPDLRPLVDHAQSPLLEVSGEGVCEVAVGPVHAGIIEPGHFRFSVMGDAVLRLELQHFYTHKGTEALMEGRTPADALLLAESVSGDNCFSHAVAFSQAVEAAGRLEAPARAQALRLVGLELERLMAHAADFGALCGDVGFPLPATFTARLKESLLQASRAALGTRCWRGLCRIGGMARDLDAAGAHTLLQAVQAAAAELASLAEAVFDTPSVMQRFQTTGVLPPADARALGVVGPAARASGLALDVRRDHPSGAYRTLDFKVETLEDGDVLARARLRILEAAASARMIAAALDALPSSAVCLPAPAPLAGDGLAAVESPRGELLYWLRLEQGFVRRCHIRSPSFQNWPALPRALPGNIIADFPLINKSFNLSYSGCDR